jgi:hypothetical protein
MTADHIQLRVAHPGPVRLRLRWSPYLSIRTLDDTAVGGACVSDDQGWVRIVTQAAGDYTISAHFDPTDYRVNNACTSNAHASGGDGRAVGRLR